ncbi:hypothetical protein PtB15_7B400 [Puccinia triticina]|nr:hypothetical protein PtB15_7B400 [Puccinia triticina]
MDPGQWQTPTSIIPARQQRWTPYAERQGICTHGKAFGMPGAAHPVPCACPQADAQDDELLLHSPHNKCAPPHQPVDLTNPPEHY